MAHSHSRHLNHPNSSVHRNSALLPTRWPSRMETHSPGSWPAHTRTIKHGYCVFDILTFGWRTTVSIWEGKLILISPKRSLTGLKKIQFDALLSKYNWLLFKIRQLYYARRSSLCISPESRSMLCLDYLGTDHKMAINIIAKYLCYYLCYCNTVSYLVIFSVWIIQTLV